MIAISRTSLRMFAALGNGFSCSCKYARMDPDMSRSYAPHNHRHRKRRGTGVVGGPNRDDSFQRHATSVAFAPRSLHGGIEGVPFRAC